MESSILGSEKILNNVECLLPSQPMAQAEGGQCLKYLAFKELRTTAGTCYVNNIIEHEVSVVLSVYVVYIFATKWPIYCCPPGKEGNSKWP
jgi:hypothetical protein